MFLEPPWTLKAKTCLHFKKLIGIAVLIIDNNIFLKTSSNLEQFSNYFHSKEEEEKNDEKKEEQLAEKSISLFGFLYLFSKWFEPKTLVTTGRS